jgi:hypothetical protein
MVATGRHKLDTADRCGRERGAHNERVSVSPPFHTYGQSTALLGDDRDNLASLNGADRPESGRRRSKRTPGVEKIPALVETEWRERKEEKK